MVELLFSQLNRTFVLCLGLPDCDPSRGENGKNRADRLHPRCPFRAGHICCETKRLHIGCGSASYEILNVNWTAELLPSPVLKVGGLISCGRDLIEHLVAAYVVGLNAVTVVLSIGGAGPA